MIAVALVSLLLVGSVQLHRLIRWRNHYLQLANDYAREEHNFSRMATPSRSVEIKLNGQPWPADEMVGFLSARKKAYLHAASYPWLSVPPALPSMHIEIRDGDQDALWGKQFATLGNFDHMRYVEADDAWWATYGAQGF
jgi:hypothetical protein